MIIQKERKGMNIMNEEVRRKKARKEGRKEGYLNLSAVVVVVHTGINHLMMDGNNKERYLLC